MENEIKRPALPAGRNVPRDLFLHLLAIVTLYWSAISFVTLLWQFINNFFPDVLDYYQSMYSLGLIRFSVSALIIVFPVFIVVSWFLNKIYAKEAVVRESKIRKWLLYLTLFITALVIIGDFIFVINTFLGGEITTRFILKALSVNLVAGVIFGYYFDDVRRDTPTKSAKYFAWGSGVLVLAAIIGAFFIVGSPTSARLVQFDQQKVSDLQNIQYQIVNYWQTKQKLPATLSDLTDPISGFTAPIDQQTKSSYEYNIKDATTLSFELCATFNKPSHKNITPMAAYPIGAGIGQNWDHGTGSVCFERTIDKQLYPPITKTK
ncbi:MAG: DUF5671 domain-containing protein [Candidatus Staskawiczbacteria bacterium]|nr:DUF5671 domain-containing protein [Candidatus Staskawiczbacteria bacterium]